MTDDRPFYAPGPPPPPKPPEPKPRELLFEFRVDGQLYRCELIDHGRYGVEAQFKQPERDYLYSRRFDPSLNLDRSPREMAIAWADEERKSMEKGKT